MDFAVISGGDYCPLVYCGKSRNSDRCLYLHRDFYGGGSVRPHSNGKFTGEIRQRQKPRLYFWLIEADFIDHHNDDNEFSTACLFGVNKRSDLVDFFANERNRLIQHVCQP